MGISVLVGVVVVGVPLLVGMTLIVVGIRGWLRARHLAKVGSQVTGVVVDNQMQSLSDGGMLFLPVVRFRTVDGRDITTVLQNARSRRSHLANSHVDVVYDPATPDRAQRARNSSGGSVVAIVAGLVFAGFALFALMLTLSATAMNLDLPSMD
ncbi:DUF3592 domain-containing protein [Actinoplanes sp. N902-109]|uniref:DUF3592 domain-containing protein n=1 Tax=Actinoplanes sp. (strain N902-109) TaxID=649831 RepID=UPI0003296783|nr:DUF3592 domain-containing protein [Actinoplanes sp. N902-109]AGL14344.1 hypothetical protein L083_0834 [Actinoplanes sp. N902-109]